MSLVATNKKLPLPTAVILAAMAMASPVASAEPSQFQPFLVGGLTFGGDRLATAVFTNGESENIDAGELIQIGGGLLWNLPDSLVSVGLSLNYHTDSSTAENGEVEFTRYPIELLAHYRFAQDWRVGGGLRYVVSPEFEGHIDFVTNETVKFDNALGLVLELGYAVTENFRVNARYVREEYDLKSRTVNGFDQSIAGVPSVDGSHFGINASYAF